MAPGRSMMRMMRQPYESGAAKITAPGLRAHGASFETRWKSHALPERPRKLTAMFMFMLRSDEHVPNLFLCCSQEVFSKQSVNKALWESLDDGESLAVEHA